MCLMPEQSFAEKGLQKPDDMEFMTALSDCLYQNLEKYSDVAAFAGNRDDLVRNEREGKLSCFLTAEDGNGIGGKREGLEKMYQMGVRLISITWNMENCLGYPNSFDPEKMALPLKPFGCEMIDAMNKMGVIVDVSTCRTAVSGMLCASARRTTSRLWLPTRPAAPLPPFPQPHR